MSKREILQYCQTDPHLLLESEKASKSDYIERKDRAVD